MEPDKSLFKYVNSLSNFVYTYDKKNDIENLWYQNKDYVIRANSEIVPNPPGYDFRNVAITRSKFNATDDKPIKFMKLSNKKRDYLKNDYDWFSNFESGKLDVGIRNKITEGKYNIKLPDKYFVTIKRYPFKEHSIVATMYDYTNGSRTTPDYNSIREIHKIKDDIIFSIDYFLEPKMYLITKYYNYTYKFLIDDVSELNCLRHRPTTVLVKDKNSYSKNPSNIIKLSYDKYGLVMSYLDEINNGNQAEYNYEEKGSGIFVESKYPLFLDTFDITLNYYIGIKKITVAETVIDNKTNFMYTRSIFIPEE